MIATQTAGGRVAGARLGRYLMFLVAAVILVWQAITCSPTSDEIGHLVSGVAMVRTGDPGFYRVNPPLHKLVSGIAVELIESPELPGIYPASLFGSGMRQEFRFAEQVLAAGAEDYHRWFWIARLIRIPLILAAAWLLVAKLPPGLRVGGAVAAVLWLSSPMVLGHGWVIMPDAISAAVMVLLLAATLRWITERDWYDWIIVGIAWGLAIGTKFTFCPLYVMWPIVLAVYQLAARRLDLRELCRLVGAHFGQGLVALVVVIGLYGGSDLGVPLGKHPFRSERLTAWIETDDTEASIGNRIVSLVAAFPSPFPQQFLVGIDEQQLDLERGYPTYVLGTWYPDGVWWYYLFGVLAKEQCVFWLGLPILVWGGWCLWKRPTGKDQQSESLNSDAYHQRLRQQRAAYGLCLAAATMIFIILSLHAKMALNVRYAMPALPALYLAIGIGAARMLQLWPVAMRRVLIGGAVVIVVEICIVFPHFFAYINPVLGGSYAVPLVLHDSNFDGGQDIWRLEQAVRQGVWKRESFYCYLNSNLPPECFDIPMRVPPLGMIDHLIATRSGGLAMQGTRSKGAEKDGDETLEGSEDWDGHSAVVVISRGYQAPAPWTGARARYNRLPEDRLNQLLSLPPDEFLTPTLAVYYYVPASPR